MELDGIEELASLIAALEALPGLLEKAAVGDGLLAAAQVVAKEAKASAAFQDRTGDLERSIRARRGRRASPPTAVVEATAPNAGLLELGTANSPARPFLEPALRNTASRQLKAFAEVTSKKFKTVE